MTTGQKIYEARRKAGMTQEALATQLGVSRQSVSKWESDNAFPETEKLIELCKLFSLSADELLLGIVKDSPQPTADEQSTPEGSETQEYPAPEEREPSTEKPEEIVGKTIDLAKLFKIVGGACAMAAVLFSLVFVFFVGNQCTLTGEVGTATGASVKLFDIYHFFGDYYRQLPDVFGSATNAFTNMNLVTFGVIMTLLCSVSLIAVIVLALLAALRFILNLLGKTEKSVTPLSVACYFTYLAFALSFNALTDDKTLQAGSLSVITVLNGATIAGLILGAVFLAAHLVITAIRYAKRNESMLSVQKIVTYASTLVLTATFFVIACGSMFGLSYPSNLVSYHTQFGAFYLFRAIAERSKSGLDFGVGLEPTVLYPAYFMLLLTVAVFFAICAICLVRTARILCGKQETVKTSIILSCVGCGLALAYTLLSWGLVELICYSDYTSTVTFPIVVLVLTVVQLVLSLALIKRGSIRITLNLELTKILASLFGLLTIIFSLIFVFFLGSNWNIGGLITSQSAEDFDIRLEGHDLYYFLGGYFKDLKLWLDSLTGAQHSIYTYNSYCATNLYLIGVIMAVIGGATVLAVLILGICTAVRFIRGLLGKSKKSTLPLVTATYFTYLGGAILWNAMLQTNFTVSGSVNGFALLQFNAPTLAGLILGFVFWAAHLVCSSLFGKEKRSGVIARQIIAYAVIAVSIISLCLIGGYGAFTYCGFGTETVDEQTASWSAHIGLGPLQLLNHMAHEYDSEMTLPADAITIMPFGYCSILLMAAICVLYIMQICKLAQNVNGERTDLKTHPVALLVLTFIFALITAIYAAITSGSTLGILQYTSLPGFAIPIVLTLLALVNFIAILVFRIRLKRKNRQPQETIAE